MSATTSPPPLATPRRVPATSATRRPAVVDALLASLRDEAGLLGDTGAIASWLAQRSAGRRHRAWASTALPAPVMSALRRLMGSDGSLALRADAAGAAPVLVELAFSAAPDDAADVVLTTIEDPAFPALASARALRLDAQGALIDALTREPFETSLARLLALNAGSDRHWSVTLRIAAGIVATLQLHASLLHRAHAGRRDVLARLAARAVAAAPDRAVADTLRAELADALQALGRSVGERCRRTVASESGVQARMLAEVAKLCESDLVHEHTRQAIRITLSRGLQVDLQQAMRRHVEQDVRTMVDEANTLLHELGAMVGRALRRDFARAQPCAVPTLRVEPFMERVEDLMQIAVRYRGTLPRRGFVHRLAEGRKSIFTVLMFVSLFGSFLGFNWRSHMALGWLFMAGFAVAVGWTYRSWQDDDRERIEEELEKAREQLRMESRRALGDVYRELQAAFVETVEGVRRTLVGDLDEAARAAATAAQRESQALRDAAQATIRQIEARDAALAAWRQALGRMDTELAALRAEEAS